MIWTILSVIAVVFPVLVVVVLIQPDEFVVERSATLAAPAAAVFAKVNDFHKWTEWSPWEKLDPNLKRTYAGNESGVGAIYTWAGNGKAGEGRMTILESKPAESILLRLEFFKPFKATTSFGYNPAPPAAPPTPAKKPKKPKANPPAQPSTPVVVAPQNG